MSFNKTVARALRVALAKNDLQQKDLAEYLNIQHQTVSKWCTTGNMSKTTLEEICEWLGMPYSQFIKLGEA